jgi:hypothetical protein
MFLFGGIDSSGLVLSDLWSLNLADTSMPNARAGTDWAAVSRWKGPYSSFQPGSVQPSARWGRLKKFLEC